MIRRTASEVLNDLELRVARLERRAGGKYPKLLKALQAWIPSLTERDLTESIDGLDTKDAEVWHERDRDYGYDDVVYCTAASEIKGELEFVWSPDVPVLDNRDRGALVDLSQAMGELLKYFSDNQWIWFEYADQEVYGDGFKGSLKLLGVRVVNNKLMVKVMADVEADNFEPIDC